MRGTRGLFSCQRFGPEGQNISSHYAEEPHGDQVQENPKVTSVIE